MYTLLASCSSPCFNGGSYRPTPLASGRLRSLGFPRPSGSSLGLKPSVSQLFIKQWVPLRPDLLPAEAQGRAY